MPCKKIQPRGWCLCGVLERPLTSPMESNMFLLVTDVIWEFAETFHKHHRALNSCWWRWSAYDLISWSTARKIGIWIGNRQRRRHLFFCKISRVTKLGSRQTNNTNGIELDPIHQKIFEDKNGKAGNPWTIQCIFHQNSSFLLKTVWKFSAKVWSQRVASRPKALARSHNKFYCETPLCVCFNYNFANKTEEDVITGTTSSQPFASFWFGSVFGLKVTSKSKVDQSIVWKTSFSHQSLSFVTVIILLLNLPFFQGNCGMRAKHWNWPCLVTQGCASYGSSSCCEARTKGHCQKKNGIMWGKFPSGGPPLPSLGIFTFFYRFFAIL